MFFRAIDAQARISSLNDSEIKSEKLSSPLHNIFQAQHQRMNSEKVTTCLRVKFLFDSHGTLLFWYFFWLSHLLLTLPDSLWAPAASFPQPTEKTLSDVFELLKKSQMHIFQT